MRPASTYITQKARKEWNKIVGTLRGTLENCNNYDEVYDTLDNNRIKGVGVSVIKETANRICEDYNIPLEDLTW